MILFTKTEYRHLLVIMNGFSDPACEICTHIRQKLEKQIESMPDDEPEFFSLE